MKQCIWCGSRLSAERGVNDFCNRKCFANYRAAVRTTAGRQALVSRAMRGDDIQDMIVSALSRESDSRDRVADFADQHEVWLSLRGNDLFISGTKGDEVYTIHGLEDASRPSNPEEEK